METNDKYISIPPHLSTNWKNVRSLHMKEEILIVSLLDGTLIEIPHLKPSTIEKVFMCHAHYMHFQGQRPISDSIRSKDFPVLSKPSEGLDHAMIMPFRLSLGGEMEPLSAAMQHNPAQANTPDLPADMLQKIAAIAKIVVPDDNATIPKPEPHCNCVHCQISRAIQQGLHLEESQVAVIEQKTEDEAVTAADLNFKEWDINRVGDQLYSVANPLDTTVTYNVHLGDPVGCTCGQTNCEHIVAVLKS